jgi:hypothetical protein
MIETSETYHVVPVADTCEHIISLDCWCQPYVDEEEEDVIIHNALDGREDFELGIRKTS